MKKIFMMTALLGLMSVGVASAQKVKETMFMQRGPLEPVNQEYKNAKTYTIKVNVPDNFNATMSKNKVALNVSSMQEYLPIWGLKSTIDGDLRVNYNITQFEYLGDRVIQKAPAWLVGIEANLEVFDAKGKLIFKRYQIPKSNTYIANPESNFGGIVNRVLYSTFESLFKDFEYYYLYQPAWSGYYFEFDKLNKLSKKDDPAPLLELNQSTQVFPSINMVNRDQWPTLFGEAQKYWEELIKYDKNRDDDINKQFRLISNASLATSYMLLGNTDKAQTYMEGIKENDEKFLGMRQNYSNFNDALNKINETRAEANIIVDFVPIEPEPILPTFLRSRDAFKAVIIEGEAINKDNEKFVGKIQIVNDNPPRIDLRTVKTGNGFGAMFSALKTDNNTVLIETEAGSKPKKMKLDDIQSIKTNDGKNYLVKSVGTTIGEDKRYAIIEEIKSSPTLTLSKEIFPFSALFLKRPTDEDFYSLPLIGIKKSLAKYFESCPAMQEGIKAGKYNSKNASNYIQIYQDYLSLCK